MSLQCRPTEPNGTQVEVLPIGDCQRSFQRPDEFREEGITSIGVLLYAVFSAPDDAFPPGTYSVVFLRPHPFDGTPAETAFALTMTNDGITGIDYGCRGDLTPEQLVASERLTMVIFAPSISPPTAFGTAISPPTAFGTAVPVPSPEIVGQAGIVDVVFINPSQGWLARGTNGHGDLLVTDDGGTSWKKQYTSEFAPRIVQFVDANNGWLAGCAVPVGLSSDCETQVLSTSDGGNTWTPVTPVGSGQIVAATFLSPVDGWVLVNPCQTSCADAPTRLFRTDNGGATWSQVALPDSKFPLSMQRVDSHHAWVLTADDILITEDGGANWTDVTNPCSLVQPNWGGDFGGGPLDFVDALHGWVGCTSRNAGGGMAPHTLYQTLDGGATWELIAETDASTTTPPGIGNAPGVGGLSWDGGLTDLHFFDAKSGWLIFDGPVTLLYHTEDGGHTWNGADNVGGGGAMGRLFFTDPMHGWAWVGLLLKTTDGGAHWQKVALPP